MAYDAKAPIPAKHRPLLPVVVAFALGILLDYHLPPASIVVWSATVAAWGLFGIALNYAPFARLAPAAAMLCVFTSGAALHDSRFHSFPPYHVKWLAGLERKLVRVQGLVIEEPSFQPAKVATGDERWPASRQSERTSFVLQARKLAQRDGWRDVCGKVRVNVYDDVPEVRYGDLVEITGYLRTPIGPRNPGQFDFARYLHRKRIEAYLSAQSAANVKPIGRDQGNPVKEQIYRLGRHFRATVDRELSSADPRDERARLVRCIVLGEREAVSDELNDAFVKTGTVHLLAVSGLNVALIASTVWFVLRLLLIPRRVNAAIIIGVVWGYAILTGLSPSVTRASLMATVFAGAVILKRQMDGISSLAAAALCVLVANPSDLFDPGAQLSFLAVLGIMTFTKPLQVALRLRPSLVEELQAPEERFWLSSKLTWSLREGVGISLAAWVVTLPLTAYYYHMFTPMIVLLNLAACPKAWLILVGGFGVLLTSPFPPLLTVTAHVTGFVARCLQWLVETAAGWGWTFLYTTEIGLPWIAAYYAFVGLVAFRKRLGLRLAPVVALGLLLGNGFVFSRALAPKSGRFSVTCLDVGSGNCLFAQLPSGETLLYDVGTSGSFDVGRNVVAPFLWREGVRTLDALFISHPHSDHYSGAPALLERFRVRRVYVNEQFTRTQSGQKVLDSIRGHGVSVRRIAQGDRIEFADGASATVLFPPGHVPRGLELSTNDLSTVLRLDWRERRVLLCGDVQTHGIHLLLRAGPDLQCDLIQVPHHGLRARNSDDFARTARPRFALVSAASHVPSGHTLQAYRKAKSLLLPTHAMGAVTVSFDEDGRATARGFVFGPIRDVAPVAPRSAKRP